LCRIIPNHIHIIWFLILSRECKPHSWKFCACLEGKL
jgi:hypothetical protein